jgi:hypothetical protein
VNKTAEEINFNLTEATKEDCKMGRSGPEYRLSSNEVKAKQVLGRAGRP